MTRKEDNWAWMWSVTSFRKPAMAVQSALAEGWELQPSIPSGGNADGRMYAREMMKNSACHDYVILTALIQTEGPSHGLSGMTTSFILTAWHWPLVSSGAIAYYSFLDQMAQAAANRAAQEAKQRGTDVKY